jgi:hypothetical protein
MKIINRPAFLKLPAGTVYSKWEPCVFGELLIKGDTLPTAPDWFYQSIADAIDHTGSSDFSDKLFAAAETGESLRMDFACEGRDGCFESDDQMFAVWERADVEALIARLSATLTG